MKEQSLLELEKDLAKVHALTSIIELELRMNPNDLSSQKRIGYFLGQLSRTIDNIIIECMGNVDPNNPIPDQKH